MPSALVPNIEQRALNAFLGLAVGDALGATVEFMTPREIKAKHGVHQDIIGGGWLHLKAGDVTDDTEMALALADAIREEGGHIVPTTVARRFSDWMSTKPKDIGHTVRRGLVRFRKTGETIVPANDHSAGNGGAMRMLPAVIATIFESEAVFERAVLDQARITHHCELVDMATLELARMMRAGLLGQSYRTDMFRVSKRVENPSGFIMDTAQAVQQALEEENGFEAALINVVNRGGDADTTGAILGAIAGAEGVPDRWRVAPHVRAPIEEYVHWLFSPLRLSVPA